MSWVEGSGDIAPITSGPFRVAGADTRVLFDGEDEPTETADAIDSNSSPMDDEGA